ncbi:hypothetical protein HUJ05_008424 [Dendroctonus ponderosae]|nr:hypothetical protein HUJ05_008424 [Dendroctonus ponderosae]
MSNISVKSCGPINCELETAKSFLTLRKFASFCGLPTCKDQNRDATSKSPFELTQTLEYCRRSNCMEFWTAASSNASKQSSTISSLRTSRTLELPKKRKSCLIDIQSSSRIFSSPECDQPSCPKKTKSQTNESREEHENEVQINICGPPECCSGIDLVSAVDFTVVCDLESHLCKSLTEKSVSVNSPRKRNEIYYCVSPSLQKELQLSDNSKEVRRYAKAETVINAHLMKKDRFLSDSCRKDSKKKLAPTHRRATLPDDFTNNPAETDEIETSFHAFRSNTTLVSQTMKAPKAKEPSSAAIGSRKSLENSQDLPKTPSPSSTAVGLAHTISPNTPFQEFPLRPQTLTSKEGNIVKSYLSGSDKESMLPATKPVQISRRNPGEVNALLKAVYSISSADFPPTPVGMEASQHGNYKLDQTELAQALNRESVGGQSKENGLEKPPAFPDTRQLGQLPASSVRGGQNDEAKISSTCSPTNCEYLRGLKKWKNCCSSPLCPINDPTSSTHNFLLKVRMCCGQRKCQLATKICDIYEPLVHIEEDFGAVGDEQYHYLATDASTEAQPESSAASIEISLLDVHEATPLEDPREELEEPSVPQRSSDSISDQNAAESSRRTSTVSWNVPHEDTAGPSTSQEQVKTPKFASLRPLPATNLLLRDSSSISRVINNALAGSLGPFKERTLGILWRAEFQFKEALGCGKDHYALVYFGSRKN